MIDDDCSLHRRVLKLSPNGGSCWSGLTARLSNFQLSVQTVVQLSSYVQVEDTNLTKLDKKNNVLERDL